MLDYLRSKRAKSPATSTPVDEPILTSEDETFLKSLTSEGAASTPAQDLPEAGDPTENQAQLVPLNNRDENLLPDQVSRGTSEKLHQESNKGEKPRSKWSWMRRDSRDTKKKSSAVDVKTDPTPVEGEPECGTAGVNDLAEKEQHEMSEALDRLNLAAVDNRVFSLSKETRELLSKCVFRTI